MRFQYNGKYWVKKYQGIFVLKLIVSEIFDFVDPITLIMQHIQNYALRYALHFHTWKYTQSALAG